MTTESLYNEYQINPRGYELKKYEEKEEVLKCLEESTPMQTDNISIEGTGCDFEWDYYNFCINEADIEIHDFIGSSLYGFLAFLEKITGISEPLICGIEYESITSLAIAVPLENNKIRFVYYYEWSRRNWQKESRIRVDIIVDKDLLIKSFKDCFDLFYKKLLEEKETKMLCYEIGIMQEFRELFNSYLNNPCEFIKTHNYKWNERIFDIAYKDTKGIWQFELCFEDDEESDIEYWQNLKDAGKILDFDFMEQYFTERLYILDKNYHRKRISRAELELETDFAARENEKNWIYSKETDNWYSTNEIMPEPKKECIEFDMFDIKVNTDKYYDAGKLISDYANGSWDTLPCILEFQDIITYRIDFEYEMSKEIIRNLDKVEKGENVRFYIEEDGLRMSIWNLEDNYLKILIHKYSSKKSDKDGGKCFLFKMKRDEFINNFKNGLNEIAEKIERAKNKSETDFKRKEVQ